MSVAPQVVLITGASRGFGAVATRELADRGHQIVATMRNPDRDGPAVVKGYEKNIQVTQCDVTDDATVQAAVATAIERHGRIDVLVNNAGQSLIGAVEELADDEFRALLDVNLVGCLRLIRAVVPHMRRRRSGKILNLSSQAGRMGGPMVGAYCASKFALEGMSEALRYDLAPWDIQVVLVQPGIVQTDHLYSGMILAAALREGRSVYQGPGEALIAGLRKDGARRQGPRTVASTIADLVEIEDPLPLRLPVSDDAVRNLNQRAAMTDDEWEARLRAMRDEGYPGSYFRAVAEQASP